MTDQELLDLWYERVLGWRLNRHGSVWLLPDEMGIGRSVESEAITAGTGWSPLTSLDDAFAGLRAHPEWLVNINNERDGNPWWVVITFQRDAKIQDAEAIDLNLCRAIVLAALQAVGVEVET